MSVSKPNTSRRQQAFTAESVPAHYDDILSPAVFEPWARVFVDAAGVRRGATVLDVATGTGVVARQAAIRAGAPGRVIATDISDAMLARSASHPQRAGGAPIEFARGPAEQLPVGDASVDVLLCQHGLQFFPDRSLALQEMHRVLRPNGVLAVSVWAAGHRLEPFDDYADSLAAAAIEPPYPRAFDNSSYVMTEHDLEALVAGAHFADIAVSVHEVSVTFPDAPSAVRGIFGTPFGPVVAALPRDQRQRIDAELVRRFPPNGEGTLRRSTFAVLVRAVKR